MVRPPSGQLSLAHHVLFLDSISALWFHLQGRWSFRQPCQMTYWDLRDTELTPLPAFCGLLLPPASFSTSGNLEFSHPSQGSVTPSMLHFHTQQSTGHILGS